MLSSCTRNCSVVSDPLTAWASYEYPLHFAVFHGDELSARTFVRLQQNPAVINKRILIPQEILEYMEKSDLSVQEQLVKGTIQQLSGKTALDIALFSPTVKMTQILLESPLLDLESPSANGFPPLHNAILESPETQVGALILSGRVDLNVDVETSLGFTLAPAHIAALTGKTNTLQLLESEGANVSEYTSDNKTVLRLALEEGHTETALAILAMDKVDLEDELGELSSLRAAIDTSNLEVLGAILDINPDLEISIDNCYDFPMYTSPMQHAYDTDNLTVFEFLFEGGYKIPANLIRDPILYPNVTLYLDFLESVSLLENHEPAACLPPLKLPASPSLAASPEGLFFEIDKAGADAADDFDSKGEL